tara:strand:+ start:2007 stop:2678 length:672 start_codon:yes stop_codon:yes gene_type:complete
MLNELFNKYGSDKGDIHGPQHKYAKFYESFLSHKRENIELILEIGICGGKSLKTWSDYFPNSNIIGLDIDDKSIYNNERVFTFKLDQSDEDQLKHFVSECVRREYKFDMILDDGSHHMLDQQITLGHLFPLLKSGGIYILEDLHTSLADSGFGLYGKHLDIQESRKNTTLYYLMESLNSIYLTEEKNQYLQQNIDTIDVHNQFNPYQEPQFKHRSITSTITKK